MYCPDCGYLNRPGAKYCAACNTPLGNTPAVWHGPLQPDELMDNGRYKITRSLGKGGMGAVYLAQNLQAFGREVVIKEMLDYFDPGDPDQVDRARERFEQEARTLAALKHPAVPDIYGYFSQAGRNYLVMEFIVGENLENGVTHRDGGGNLVPALPYTQEQIILFGIQLCDLLIYLAKRTNPTTGEAEPVIHHDIKPANILRDPETENVWLVDFGTAKTRFKGDPSQTLSPDGGQPTSGKDSIYGTVGYAPIEQYQGESIPKSDVYALAATLYHLLTDDDPRDHPFQFGKLDSLPLNLRLALKGALEQDAVQRSDADEFHQALKACMPDAPQVEAQPLTFPEGKTAKKLSDIVPLAQEYWDYSRDILYDGDLEYWLRRSLHNPVVAETARRVTTGTLDKDTGLDAFLRELDPSIPGGKLKVQQTNVDLGVLTTDRPGSAILTLDNNGSGFCQGTVESSAGWLREKDGRFGIKPGGTDELIIEADTGKLMPGQQYKETLTVKPSDGSRPISINVSLAIAEGTVSISPTRLVFNLAISLTHHQAITLTNTGGNKIECTITRSDRWILIKPKKVTLPPGQALNIDVSIRPDKVPPVPRPKGMLTITPDHGPKIHLPIEVQSGRKTGIGRILRAILTLFVFLVFFVFWFILPKYQATAPKKVEPAPIRLSAEELDAAQVPVGNLLVDKYEVTNLQYARFDANHTYNEADALLPVVNVTWEEAKAYCQWAKKSLPDESEWELAAAGSEGRIYPWGDEVDHSRVNSQDNRNTSGLLPVDSLPQGATPDGILNLLGNASEWVVGPPEHPRTHRGGSFEGIGLTNSRSYWEDLNGVVSDTIGFRCVTRPAQ